MSFKNNNNLKLLVFALLFIYCQCLFSKYYKKCKLFQGHNGREISSLTQQRVASHPEQYYIQPLIETRKPLEYIQLDYFYHEYVGAGGSGQVFLVEDLKTHQPKILKRFFKEKVNQFEQQNFIMQKLNYKVSWTRDTLNGVPKKTNYSKDINSHDKVPTIAIYPSKQTFALRDIQFFAEEAPLIFYKLLVELDKAHRNSIIHNDLKMGNILINQMGRNFKFFEVQLIDWNLAGFYYLGQQTSSKKGTVCYYSPQQIMRAQHITPAIDVWALAVVMFSFFTDTKPFFYNCKQNNLKAIATLVGIDKIINLHRKYKYPLLLEYTELLEDYAQNPEQYEVKGFRHLIPAQRKQFFTEQLIDMFERMLEVDPQQRITVSQLLNHEYFKKIKRIPPMFQQKQHAQNKKQQHKVQQHPMLQAKVKNPEEIKTQKTNQVKL